MSVQYLKCSFLFLLLIYSEKIKKNSEKIIIFSTFRETAWILNPTFQNKQKNRQRIASGQV
nr:MAG TPA: hypothetical protein [Caudoviricetes sp.]